MPVTMLCSINKSVCLLFASPLLAHSIYSGAITDVCSNQAVHCTLTVRSTGCSVVLAR